jgi:hypothetical protein
MALPQMIDRQTLDQIFIDAGDLPRDQIVQGLVNNGHTIDGLETKQQNNNGFFGRLKDSILSSSERFQRGFGSKGVREGRTETSKGFDLADLPGDIADIIGPAMPVATSILGAVGAAGPAIPTGPGAIAAGAVGAAAGAGVGETGRREIGNLLHVEERFGGREKTPFEDIIGIGKETIIGGASELIGGQLVGRPLAAAGRKLLVPFAKHFSDDLARIAARRSIDLPVSAISDDPLVEIGEAVASKGFFGGRLKTVVNTAKKQLDDSVESFIKKIGGSDDIITAGKSIAEGVDEYRSAWMKGKSKIYKAASDIAKDTINKVPDTTNTIALLDELIADDILAKEVLGEGFDMKILTTMRKNLSEGKSFEAIDAAISKLAKLSNFGGRDFVTTGDPALIRKVASTLDDDIMKWLSTIDKEAYQAATQADEFFKSGISALNDSANKTITSLADEPSKLLNKTIRPKSPEQASKAIELIIATEGGAERVANLQTAFVRELVESAKGTSDDLAGAGLERILNKYGDETLDAVLGEDSRIFLRETARVSQALSKSQKISGGSQTAFLLVNIGKVQAIVSAFSNGHPFLASGIIGGDALLTSVFNTNIGKKWLTEGLTSPTVFEKFGGTAARVVGRGIEEGTEVAVDELTDSQ